MIISLRSLSYEDLKKQLSKEDKIVIWSCDTCVRFMGLAGYDKMKILERMLKADGYTVIKKELISVSCVPDLIETRSINKEKKEIFDEATAIIVLACEEGCECVSEFFKDKKVIKTFRTVGVGNISHTRGMLLTNPYDDINLEPKFEGLSLKEVADKLELYDKFFDADFDKLPDAKKVEIIVDGKKCLAEEGENLQLELESLGFRIPHLCYRECLPAVGACRLCLVKVEGSNKLVASCTSTVVEGMKITTHDEQLYRYRKMVLELILTSHDHNCLFCPSNNNCELQELIHEYGIDSIRFKRRPVPYPIDFSSEAFIRDSNRCILCGRCVRTCQEVAGIHNLDFINRGAKTLLCAGLNQPLGKTDCVTCLACVFACPTGALHEKMVHYVGDKFEPTKIYGNYKNKEKI